MYEKYAFRPEDWGHLAERYCDERPRKMLALDGGGIRGIISLRVLKRLEKLLGKPLSNYFDYIAGTSTGAIIAGCLAMGMTVREIEIFYRSYGKQIFKKRPFLKRWYKKFKAAPLEEKLKNELRGAAQTENDPDLKPEYLRCLFMSVTRNATTDSVWPISSNPAAKFNDPHDSDCNLRIPMWEILRASSAAPTFFPPHKIILDPRYKDSAFTFVDGGTTPYNNPSFLLYRMATKDPYHLRWSTGEDKLLLISVGTGITTAKPQQIDKPQIGFVQNVEATIEALMHQANLDQDINCRTIGRCMHGHELDWEIGDLILRDKDGTKIGTDIDTGRDFLYLRYNIVLNNRHLEKIGLPGLDIKNIKKLDSVSRKSMQQLTEIGDALANQVNLNDFGSFAI